MVSSADTTESFQLYLQAGSTSISGEELAAMVDSRHACVRLRVAENPRTPSASIALLAVDECSDVRLAVATHSAATVEILRKIASDEDPTVRYGMAEDANTPLEILEELASDENPYVGARAIKTLKALAPKAPALQCHPRFLPDISRPQISPDEALG